MWKLSLSIEWSKLGQKYLTKPGLIFQFIKAFFLDYIFFEIFNMSINIKSVRFSLIIKSGLTFSLGKIESENLLTSCSLILPQDHI